MRGPRVDRDDRSSAAITAASSACWSPRPTRWTPLSRSGRSRRRRARQRDTVDRGERLDDASGSDRKRLRDRHERPTRSVSRCASSSLNRLGQAPGSVKIGTVCGKPLRASWREPAVRWSSARPHRSEGARPAGSIPGASERRIHARDALEERQERGAMRHGQRSGAGGFQSRREAHELDLIAERPFSGQQQRPAVQRRAVPARRAARRIVAGNADAQRDSSFSQGPARNRS